MGEKEKLYNSNGEQIFSIYKWTNLKNNKIYIGKTERIPEIRKQEHINDSLNQNRDHYYLHKSIAKHGPENFLFEIILQCKNITLLDLAESEIILQYNSTNKDIGYNLTEGGDGGKMSEQTRLKMSESKLGEKNNFYGKTHTSESKKIISESASKRIGQKNPFFGKKHSKQSIEKMKLIQSTLPRKSWFDDVEFLKEIIYMRKNKYSFKEIADKFDFHEDTIESVLKGKGIYKEKLQNLLPDYIPEYTVKPFSTHEEFNNLKKLYSDGYTQKEIGNMFNIGQTLVSKALNYKGYYKKYKI